MRIYIAGPMRGIPHFNFPEFFQAEASLRSLGFTVYNPARVDADAGFPFVECRRGTEDLATLGFDLRAALGASLDWIARHADGLAYLPGSDSSLGAQAEIAAAKAVGIPALSVTEWLGGEPQ